MGVEKPRRSGWLVTLLQAMSFLSSWAAGFLGAVVVRYLGPYLAMYFQMWAAFNTEPVKPHADYPVAWTVIFALLPLPWALNREWRWASVAAVPFVLLPWWHFRTLYLLAGRG